MAARDDSISIIHKLTSWRRTVYDFRVLSMSSLRAKSTSCHRQPAQGDSRLTSKLSTLFKHWQLRNDSSNWKKILL